MEITPQSLSRKLPIRCAASIVGPTSSPSWAFFWKSEESGSDYLRRIEALEASIAPPEQIVVVICRDGEDEDAAVERECAAKGLRHDDPHLKVICATFVKSPFSTMDAD